jgi:hypothetical protein
MAAGDGLVSMTPTSIAHSGTSASINADGGVDFTAVTSLSLNGVFTSDYDNYLIVASISGDAFSGGQLRVGGVDASGTDYAYQLINASNTTITGVRSTSRTDFGSIVDADGSATPTGYHVHLYGPALAQPTAVRNVGLRADAGARLRDFAMTHSLSTSYDGITFISAGSTTGNVHVFGYEE